MNSELCRLCGDARPSKIYELGSYPLTAGPVTLRKEHIDTCSLVLGLCPSCGTYSLLNREVDDLVYGSDYTSSNITYGYSPSMDALTEKFLSFVGKSSSAICGSRVLEIGCYDGSFLKLMSDRFGYWVMGCETCAEMAKVAQSRGYAVRTGYFRAEDYSDLDMVVARNVLEHIAYPLPFIAAVASVLKRNGALLTEIPDGEHAICKGILGTIVPEHPCYYGEASLTRLLRQYFHDVEVSREGASLQARASRPLPARLTPNLAAAQPAATGERPGTEGWLGASLRHLRYVIVARGVAGETVGLFGANTCALELLSSSSINKESVDSVYDDDPRRWGKYLVNTTLEVRPREAVTESKHRKVVVCSYTHRHGIAGYLAACGKQPILPYDSRE